MPWSQWFDGRPVSVGVEQALLAWDSRWGDTVSSSPSGLDYMALEDVGQLWDADGHENTRKGWQFAPASNWRLYRDWFPDHLRSLQEDVDYAVRPDRTEDDTDAYIQYEGEDQPYDVDATPKWVPGAFRPSSVDGGDGTVSPDMSVTWEVSWRAPTDYPTTVGEALTPWPGGGTTIGAGTARIEGGGAVEVGIDTPELFTGVLSWTVLAEVIDVQSFNGHPPTVATLNAYFERPKFYAVPPRWRYWIPETVKRLPLRQRQRDDGLGMSTARWRRGRSVQASNRWRSYR